MSRRGDRILIGTCAFPVGAILAALLFGFTCGIADRLGLFPDVMQSRAFLPLLWLFIFAGGMLGVARVVADPRHRRRVRYERGECLSCGYSLTGNESGICPECGTRVGV